MTTPDGFFEAEKPAAALKHGILRRYLPPFVMRAGSASFAGRVAYVDGYAGPGVYDDGSKGSPALAVETARIVAEANTTRRIEGYFVEQDPLHCEYLRDYLDEQGLSSWSVYKGDVKERLEEITNAIDPQVALFAFLDPFGLCIPLDMIQESILARAGRRRFGVRDGAPTEVLINFSYSGLRRTAGHLTSSKDYPARDAFIARLDAALDGDWWHGIWESDELNKEDQIRRGYVDRIIRRAPDWSVYTVPVTNGLDRRPVYDLLFLTQHEAGVWTFNEALSNSMEEHRHRCVEEAGQLDLQPLADREKLWIDEIEENARKLVTQERSFVVGLKAAELYGEVLGYAREKHARRALRRLYDDGAILTEPKGKLEKLRVQTPRA